MKKICYIIIAFVLGACTKEDLDQPVLYENLYLIQDDPSDPVKHRIYELYEKYGASIYFNDTIGKYYVKYDANGNPYYRYELLDLNWNFYSDNSQNVTYDFFYQTDRERQMISLDFAEQLLEHISRKIQPYALFFADSIARFEKNKGEGYLMYAVQFRSVWAAGLHRKTEMQKDSLIDKITRSLISMKISKFKSSLNEFNSICKAAWYDCNWNRDLGLNMNSTWGPSIFTEFAKQWLMAGTKWDAPWTEEQVEAERDRIRDLIGQYGFVGGSSYASSILSPENTSQDLDTYMNEILSCDRAEFTRRWGNCPLVMRKYEILYNLLKDELDYEL